MKNCRNCKNLNQETIRETYFINGTKDIKREIYCNYGILEINEIDNKCENWEKMEND